MIERQPYKESSSIGNLEPRAVKVVGYMRGHLLPAITTSLTECCRQSTDLPMGISDI